jgi:hypothetical protein
MREAGENEKRALPVTTDVVGFFAELRICRCHTTITVSVIGADCRPQTSEHGTASHNQFGLLKSGNSANGLIEDLVRNAGCRHEDGDDR